MVNRRWLFFRLSHTFSSFSNQRGKKSVNYSYLAPYKANMQIYLRKVTIFSSGFYIQIQTKPQGKKKHFVLPSYIFSIVSFSRDNRKKSLFTIMTPFVNWIEEKIRYQTYLSSAPQSPQYKI